MDRQLAERMVGAACILAVLVLVVPAVLDGNPDSGATITHPETEDDLDLRTHTILLDGTRGDPPVPTPRQADVAPLAPPQAAPQPLQPKARQPEEAAAEPEVSGSDNPVEAAAPAPTGVPEPRAVAKAAPVPKGTAAGDWFVQLGSFSRRDNADRLAADLRSKGYTAGVESGGGSSGTLFRVRAGPVPDKPAAETLAASLAKSGFKGGRIGRQ